MTTLRIGTRGSALALWQAHRIEERLRALDPGLRTEIVAISTVADRIQDRQLSEIGGKGLFVKEIEHALLDGRVDVAVHSLKDMPIRQPDALELVAYPERDSPLDALCGASPLTSIADLRVGARVGTGSLRRGAQLRSLRADLEVVPVRGNVATRLARRDPDSGDLDAVVLAEAGLRRLEQWSDGYLRLGPPEFIAAPAQGILAVEVRADDRAVSSLCAQLDDPRARLEAATERACLAAIGGDCHTPFGALARQTTAGLTLIARLHDPTGASFEASEHVELTGDAAADLRLGFALGTRLGEQVLAAAGSAGGDVQR